MAAIPPEILTQVDDFDDPSVFDIMYFESIFDENGLPYIASPLTDYHPDGPQPQLGPYDVDDITSRKERDGIVNITEQQNLKEYYSKSMTLLLDLRALYMKVAIGEDRPLTNHDGTVFQWKRKWYYAWSGWENKRDRTQNLYIARLSNPWTVATDRVCISRPEYAWEHFGAPNYPKINEGPQALEHDGKLFIIYSASHSLTDDYCLGQLTLVGNDPLKPESWVKHPEPVFSKEGSIMGPGHASFIEKPDGTDWIIYHANKKGGRRGEDSPEMRAHRWDTRILRAQPFTWHPDGSPNFGKPRALKAIGIPEVFKTVFSPPPPPR